MALLLVVSALAWSTASAQLPTPLPQPNVNLLTSGYVLAIARLPDGSVVIGGQFVSVNGVLRSNIAKRLADGTLDSTWHPTIDGDVRALAVDADGNVYVGGDFSHADGYARRNLVKISPAGSVITGWDPSPDGLVEAILSNAAGDVFVGGRFANIGGQTRGRLAKVSASTGLVDLQWNPAPAAATTILALRLSHDGQLYVGGQFTGIGGLPQRNIAKVSMSGLGAVDPDWDPSPNNTVTDIAVSPDGSVFVTGEFWQFRSADGALWFQSDFAKLSGTGGGLIVVGWDPPIHIGPRTRRIALDGNEWLYINGQGPALAGGTSSEVFRVSQTGSGSLDTQWNPRVDGSAYVLLFADGALLAGGNLYRAAGQVRLGFVALNPDASPASAFDAEAPTAAIFATAVQSDGRLIVSGRFAKANGHLRGGLLRLNADGSLDTTWNPSPIGYVRAITFATDGSAIVGGAFSRIGGQSADGIAKLALADGVADPAWRPGLEFGYVGALASDAAGLIYAGGTFRHGSGAATQQYLVRIGDSGSGEVDTAWQPNPAGEVQELSLDGQGALFVRGTFLTMTGEPRVGIAKLLTTGPTVLDPDWNPQISGPMYQIVADGLGSLYVAGGIFPIAGGGSTAAIAKLSTSGVGAADPLWRPFTDRVARRIAVDTARSSLYAFSTIYDPSTGVDSYYLSKHSTNGTGEVDTRWNPSINDFVSSMSVDGDKLLLGGYFTQVSGQQRYGVAALPLNVPDLIHANGFDSSP